MNANCYKIIFSKHLGTLVAVGEHTNASGKTASGQACRARHVLADAFVGLLRFSFATIALACLTLNTTQAQQSLPTLAATALPQGGTVNTGAVTVSTTGAAMAITQATDKASINWQSFNIGSTASVNIAQPSASAVLLNRVVGNDPSQIFGKLTANGQVILLNPNGVVFGKEGSVTASTFTASTFALSDADFMAGYYKYARNGSTAAVVNQGTIETSAGGFVALIGATVTNEGTIHARQGDVVLAAAESVTLPSELVKPQPSTTPNTVSVRMSKRVRLELDPAAINTAVNNTESGVIVTEGGQVLLQAAALSSAVASVTHSGRIDTSAPQAGAVTVLADNGVIKVNGSITANSSGTDGQGPAHKGGDIIIGRDEETGVLAKATDVSGAKLESQGGFLETSGEYLESSGVKVKAAEWLLDPNNIEVNLTNVAVTAGNSVVLAGDIANALTAGTSVTISTGTGAGSVSSATGISQATAGTGNTSTGTIDVNSAITSTYSGATNPALTFSAASNITVNAAISTTGSDIVLKSTGGAISNTAAISGRNVSIDNTGGTVDATTGAITAGASASTSATGISVGANITATGDINIQGNVTSASNTGVRIASGAGVTSSGAGSIINIGSNYAIAHAGSIKTTNNTGTGTNINLTATSGAITGTGTIGDATNKNSSVSMTTGVNGSFSGGINAQNFTKAGTAILTLDSWNQATPVQSKVSSSYTVNAGSLTLQTGNNYYSIAPTNVYVNNGSTFSTGTGNGQWNNTTFTFGSTGGGTLNLSGNPIGSAGPALSATNTIVTTGGATNYVLSSFNSNFQTVTMNVANATSGDQTATGAYAGLVFKNPNGTNKAITNGNVVNKTGAGTVMFLDDLTFNTLNITSGTVQIGNGVTTSAGGLVASTAPGAINISADAKLTIHKPDAITIAATISGAGDLNQSGAGTTTLTGTNTYSGTTTISAGTLKVGNGGATGSLGSGAVVDNAALIINRDVSADTTIANAISGTGTLTQAGLGKTILTGTNTYSGTTTISAGTLQVGNGGATGTLGSGAIVDNAALIIDRDASADITIANVISGTGTLTQAGLGKTILTANNTYSGTTTISAGTLQVGNGGATGTLGSGAVVDNAALIIERDASTDITIAGDISGTGTLTQAGLGKTILTGTNTYSGTTTISAGTLQVGNGGATGTLGSGSVVDNATLIINRDASANTTIANAISGTGTLTQAGLGKTILTANNTYSGTTTISAGTLQVGNDTTTGTLGTGAVINNALLDFKRSANTDITNTITGSGNLHATLSAGGLKLSSNVTLDGNVNLTAEHATDWAGVQFLGNLSAAGDINISGGSSTLQGVRVDAFKTIQTTGLAPQSVTISGSTSSANASGIAIVGEIQTQNGSTLLATGTATNGGDGIYSELTTGGTNYGKIGSATSGDITLVGTSSGGTTSTSINSNAALNRGHGILLRGGITTQGKISLTGTADNGVGVFLQHSTYDYGRTMAEIQPTLQVLSGGANMAGQNAISISGTNHGSNVFSNNGVLIGSQLINNSNGGATTITSTKGGIALVTSTTGTSTGSGTITNAATAGAISLTAGNGTATSPASIGNLPASIGTGNNVSSAWTLSPAGTQITQNSNAGVTITSDGTGNVTPSKIVNNGSGDVVIGAGTQLAAGNGTGGQVLTVSGNTISQSSTGKTYVYTGAAANTGALSNLSSSLSTLYFTGTAPSAFNSAFNTAFGSTIASGQSTQVLFRESTGPDFVLTLPNITKTYGDADPTNLNATLQTAYTNSGGGTYLTQAVSGAAGGSNTFAIKASELIADVNITRAAGETVGNYALNMVGATMNAGIAGGTSLSIGKRNITLAGITASNKTYDGSSADNITAGTFNNLAFGETLLISGTGSFADANVGNGKTVSANIANLNKTNGTGSWSNYNLTSTGSLTSTANITAAALTVTVNGSSAFVTQDPSSAFNLGFSYNGFVNGETAASALTALPTRSYIGAPNPTVGTYANVYDIANTVSAKNGNYTITVNKGALTVIAADALLFNVASQSSIYGSITAANADTPAANTVTAQYCLAPLNCNGSNIVNLSLRKDSAVANQWIVNDSTSSTVQFTTALQGTSYSSGGYLQVGNYDYSLSASSPVVIGTQNFNTVVSNAGSLSVTPLAVSLQTTPVSKPYDGTTDLPATTLSINNLAAGDDLQVGFTSGTFQSSAVSTTAAFSLYGVALAGLDSANYTLQNYPNNTYSNAGSITSTTANKSQPILHPPKPIIPSNNTAEGGGESGGGSSASNPYLVIPSQSPNNADRCTPNSLEDCLCETQAAQGIAICYQPKKTASNTHPKGRPG